MILSLIIIMGIMIPAHAAEASAAVPEAKTSETTAETPEAAESVAPIGPSQEQLFLTMSMLLQMRQLLPLEENMEGIYKTINGLKAGVKDVQLSYNQFLSIFFYTLENQPEISTSEPVQFSWSYTTTDGGKLNIKLALETFTWSINTSKHPLVVTMK